MDHDHYYDRIDEKLEELPWYVGEFIDQKRRQMAATTLLNYCHDYIIFFDWLIAEGFFKGPRQEVDLATLEKLTLKQIESFLTHLETRLHNSKPTVNRKISSLKSLFHYLQNIAETPELEPYIYRNIMAKISFNPVKEDIETVANRIEGKILHDDEYEQFRQFVAFDYGKRYINNKKRYNFHLKNRERDTALISLMLGSGLRLSEVSSLDLDDIDYKKHSIHVTRKGGKEQFVYFSEQAMTDLQEYIDIRDTRYQLPKKEKALFVSTAIGPNKASRRLSNRAIEKIVEKYAAAFGKPALSVHKLRHSFATRYHKENNDIPKLKKHLGHSSVQTTMIYTHMTNKEMKKAIDHMDRITRDDLDQD
ncbi:site-specific recombinase XerD [Pullulanibacillus pueri]|uniref:Tyrosine recombinase XerS n=1 Tax=Pullulanibacillus pueri TaxID=1437324 RepID=A0A8J2ZVX6_9BACL|nr:tyrosine recombinase XerS [Pullulanibacillus pueri]MBM7682363.1 site-specific recombinase XerD [Pullulanibacillus pueri]GGH80642.1 tyrosine recombinase XerS [Pullulanibacillus pueri]